MVQTPIPNIINQNCSPEEIVWEEMPFPDVSNIIIEDDTPVDNLISEKQQRLLTVSLYSSLIREKPFLATTNVGLFYAAKQPPLVPDVLLSLGVTIPEDWSEKRNRSYFVWNFGKLPEVAIEIVSNTVGNELTTKLVDYATAGVPYYVVFDPLHFLGDTTLYIHELKGGRYYLLQDYWLSSVELGLTLWSGNFEGKHYTWLRWCDRHYQPLLTGDEKAEQEKQRADSEKQRADSEKQRADRLAELLRSHGIDPLS